MRTWPVVPDLGEVVPMPAPATRNFYATVIG
jgi:hypothetical protein